MKVPAEFAKEFAGFPEVLKKLVQAELRSGNSIVALEHGFPAAPCGASIKLARVVNERRRKSGGGLVFYERNNPDYAGEFTTEQRHFFVLEPPPPPVPPPDMDAIRKSLEPKPDPLLKLAERPAGSGLAHFLVRSGRAKAARQESIPAPAAPASRRAIISTESPVDRMFLLHFIDKRPPHEIQIALEREVMTLNRTCG